MSSTRLDDLSDEALQNVVRHLSSKPRKVNWTKYVRPQDALTSVHSSSPLSDVASSSFPVITLPMSHELVAEWLQSAGESLVDLTMNRGALHGLGSIEPTLESLVGNSRALRRLDIGHLSPTLPNDLLRATRGRLHELVANRWAMKGIELHCMGLRKLVLYVAHYDYPAGRGLDGMLRAAGSTLESFKIRAESIMCSRKQFEEVREHCPKLSSIHILAFGDATLSAYADLLCSYGAQLRFVHLHQMSTSLCERVVASCERFRCGLDRMHADDLLGKMNVLGTRVTRVRMLLGMSLVEERLCTRDISSASLSCTRLEQICLDVCSASAASAIKALRCDEMPLLSEFDLNICDVDEVGGGGGEGLWELSKYAASLRSFSFNGLLQDNAAFEALALGSPTLQRVRLCFPDNFTFDRGGEMPAWYQTRVEDVVNTFLDCPKLRQLRLQAGERRKRPLETITNMCRRMQLTTKPDLNVTVLGVDY